MAKSAPINLLKRAEKKFIDRFISWVFTGGRLITYITFAIALSALIYRGFLDRQLVDLHDSIKQKQTILAYSKTSEEKFRNLQNRLNAATVGNNAKDVVTIVTDIIDFASDDATFTTITSTENLMSFDITLKSVQSLTDFIGKVKGHPRVTSVTLSKIDDKLSNTTITASISLALK